MMLVAGQFAINRLFSLYNTAVFTCQSVMAFQSSEPKVGLAGVAGPFLEFQPPDSQYVHESRLERKV